jgi:hypothetical protein
LPVDPDVHQILIEKVFVRAATVVTSDAVLEALDRARSG